MSPPSLNVGILASTNGTILPSIVTAKYSRVHFSVFVTDKKKCGAREKAQSFAIPDFFVSPKGKTREEWGKEAAKILQDHQVDIIILIGFMRILDPSFVRQFPGKILNVHPSLLPKFSGGMNMNVHESVLNAEETESGATIHLVTDEVDEGPIVLQQSVSIEPDETPETLQKKVQALEMKLFPKAIKMFAESTIGSKN